MRLLFTGDIEKVRNGISLIKEDLRIEVTNDGFPVNAVCRNGGIEVCLHQGKAEIYYEKPCHFYRGLALLMNCIKHHNQEAMRIVETPQIKRVGLLLDLSRNAVLTVKSVKHFLRKMALMGMDLLMLYMEDIYYLKGYERFGYMRGRYTEQELRDIDNYAFSLNIEVMPYIQTLAHMGQILKGNDVEDIRDTRDIILVGEEKTYLYLEEMIRTVSSFFRSNRINLGMDEAHELGLGKYLSLNGYRDQKEIMQEHLDRVLKITDKYGLKTMMASDMLFHKEGEAAADHYEMGSNTECAIDLPENIDLMYWDYFHTDVQEIREFIRRHKAWGKIPTYFGGVRTWEGFSTGYSQTFENSKAAIAACASEGVEEAVVAVWLNDGAENSLLAALPGMSYFAQQIYNANASDAELKEYFLIQSGADLDSFLLLGELDKLNQDVIFAIGDSSKYLLWQDVLLGFFDYHISNPDLNSYYQRLGERMEKAKLKMGYYRPLMEMMSELSGVLAIKSTIGIEIKQAYDSGDLSRLKEIANTVLPKISDAVEELRVAHRKLWVSTLKPFGWEVLDIRYGGLQARLNTAAQRILDYVDKDIDQIEELEETRIPYMKKSKHFSLVYDQIISSGYLSGPVKSD